MKTFWQHENGMVYVVESDSFGRVTGGAGPFRPGELRDPSEYRCGCGVVAWLNQAIVERKLLRINPEIPKDAPPPPTPSLYPRGSRQKTPAAEQRPAPAVQPRPRACRRKIPAAQLMPAPPPCQPVVPAKAPQRQEGEPDNLQREKENRRKFAWASAYRL